MLNILLELLNVIKELCLFAIVLVFFLGGGVYVLVKLERRKRCWKIVNSSFAIWLFASVVLGGALSVYNISKERIGMKLQKLESENNARKIREELIVKLDLEIATRLQDFYTLIDGEIQPSKDSLLKAFSVFNKPNQDNLFPFGQFKEFSGIGTYSLISLQIDNLKKENIKDPLLESALKGVRDIRIIVLAILKSSDPLVDKGYINKIKDSMMKLIENKRWFSQMNVEAG